MTASSAIFSFIFFKISACFLFVKDTVSRMRKGVFSWLILTASNCMMCSSPLVFFDYDRGKISVFPAFFDRLNQFVFHTDTA